MRTNSRRRGAILIEVIVGLTVLALAGVAWITLMAQTTYSIHQLRGREHDMRAAADDLEHVALWTPSQLSAQSGTTRIGSYLLTIQPLTAQLFTAAVADSNGGPLLTTSIYAPGTPDSTSP